MKSDINVLKLSELGAAASQPPTPVEQGKNFKASLISRILLAPSVIPLFVWMIVPLVLTLYFSVQHYSLLNKDTSFAGLENFRYIVSNPDLLRSLINTVLLTCGVMAGTIVIGVPAAVLLHQKFIGQKIVRLMVIAPFFVMPTVAAVVWKNLLMNPVNGLFAFVATYLGFHAVDWFADLPLTSIGIIVTWQWMPFATLVLLTALQSLDNEQLEAAKMDGAGPISLMRYIILPHLGRAISVVVMLEAIFLLSVFAEILVTTSGGPGTASTTLSYMIYKTALLNFDVGGASAIGIVAVILANVVAVVLVRTVARSIDR
ncbi:sorbitol/mannitol transport system permease protein [Herbaspirillum sp. 1173]|uniref:carbohydrate ABC transporter permease n=1 Tax=Herbaspirillum sp. 1173 TaxID=2817734 RepID=UPI00285F4BC3|nr:sugar ABC transporter permease [Herbaspirillum sp. 1173]MDR6743317.1 sorbitol/mannitol transport system permease protein [Herbaspirillum sp. 1173]